MNTFQFFKLPMVVGFLITQSVAQANYTGEMFEIGSNKTKKLFTVKVEQKVEGDKETMMAVITDPSGQVVLTEKTLTQKGQIVDSQIDQKQIQTTATIEVKGDQVLFTKTKDGKTKSDDEKKKDTFVTTGNFQSFVQSRWDELLSGKTVEFRYGVWDRMETVGFEIKKISEEDGADKKILLQMKPSSMIIAALVNPIQFKFSASTKKLAEMKGRVGPKQNVNGKWKDLDAEVVYTYQ